MTAAEATTTSAVWRPPSRRPSVRQVVGRTLATTLVTAVALGVTSWIVSGFDIDEPQDAVLAGLVIGLIDALVWPAFAFVLVPLSVYTLGLASLAVNALLIYVVLDELPGVSLDGAWAALAVTVVMTVVSTTVSTA
ncbi:MAG TPA: phage holin family protein, partial [Ilumatobacteraceae bacterium]|nr:phage holin family protein [Ilumatobacteraceae bacterium]